MSSRIPGTIGFILNQTPRTGASDGGVRTTVSHRAPLNRKEVAVKAAVVRGPSAPKGFDCSRGDTITLEATGSAVTGALYEWTLTAAELPVVLPDRIYTEDNPPPRRTVVGRKQGRQVKVVALAPFTATLVVKDSTSASPPSSIEVRVRPRPWAIKFVQQTQLQYFSEFYSANALLERHGGSNICTICKTDEPYSHWIHRSKDLLDWKQQLTLKQVTDPDGPFDGLWYVEKADLRIDRSLYINSELTSGQVFRLNSKKDTLAKHRDGLKKRIDCTKRHEQLHGELVKEKLAQPGMDPAPRVEALIGEEEKALAEQANTEIALKENFLSNASTGPEGHGELRRRLEAELETTEVTLLLPQTRKDEQGIPVRLDLLQFSD